MAPWKTPKPEKPLDLPDLDYRLPSTWCDHNHRRIIMAALVQAVYRLEKVRPAVSKVSGAQSSTTPLWWQTSDFSSSITPLWWRTVHFDLVRPLMDNQDTGSVFGAVFKSRLNHNRGHLGAPHIVVAFRGTLIKNMTDMIADLRILFHRLRCHKRFHDALRIVSNEVDSYGAQSVCLAGHSKGAALALLVGRDLAAEKQLFVETHLFNPPYPTLPMPGKAHEFHNFVANCVSRVLQDEETRTNNSNAFLAIRTWFPHLYINAHDPICSSYLGYFEANSRLPDLLGKRFGFALSPTPHSIRGIIRSSLKWTDARPDHLIPSAYLHINPSAHSMFDAHRLKQWRSLDVQLTPWEMVFDPAGYILPRSFDS